MKTRLLWAALVLWASPTHAQLSQAQLDALVVSGQNLARGCAEYRAGLPTENGPLGQLLQQASCSDLGFDPESLQLEISGEVSPAIRKALRQCIIDIAQAEQTLTPTEFRALSGQSCLSPQVALSPLSRKLGLQAELQSTRIQMLGPGPENVRISAVDRQGRTIEAEFHGSMLSILTTEQRRMLALKNDAAPLFYACLIRLGQLQSYGTLPGPLIATSCENIGVTTYGLPSEIHFFPWTAEKYQLSLTTPTGQVWRWPDRTMPTEAQKKAAEHAKQLRIWGLSVLLNAAFALLAFTLLVQLPRVRFLDEVFALIGGLAVLFAAPLLWGPSDFGDAVGLAYFYIAVAGFALFGSSLWLACTPYWRTSLWHGLGMGFKAGGIMFLAAIPISGALASYADVRFLWWMYPLMGLALAAYWQWFRPQKSPTTRAGPG